MSAKTQPKEMASSPLRIRWIIENCFEIKLPNGKTIVIDPMLPGKPDPQNPKMFDSFYTGYTAAELEGCDYVLVNHSHGDHIGSLHDVYARFEPLIICHAATAMDIAEGCNVPPRKIFPFVACQTFDFGDFKLETFPGQHSASRGDAYFEDSMKENIARGNDKAGAWLGLEGTLFNTNFIITTPDNVTIAFNAGLFTKPLEKAWQDKHPNILLKHLVHIEREHPTETMAEIIETVGAQLTLPMTHQRGCTDMEYAYKGKFDINEYTETVNGILAKKGVPGRMFSPESGKWHTLSVTLSAD